MISRLDTRRPAGHAAGLSQKVDRLSGPVSAVFLCPHAGTPNFGVADGNRTPAQVGNTVAGCFRPERTPIPGKGLNSQKTKAMKKTTRRAAKPALTRASRAAAPETLVAMIPAAAHAEMVGDALRLYEMFSQFVSKWSDRIDHEPSNLFCVGRRAGKGGAA